MIPEDNFPADLGMVPTGTKCANNMVRKLAMLLLAVSINKRSKSVNLFHCPNNGFTCLSGMLQSTV